LLLLRSGKRHILEMDEQRRRGKWVRVVLQN
jgi:hypothetical protein